MARQEKGYTPLYSDERSVTSLDNVEVELSEARSKQPSQWHRFRSWTLHAILIIAYSTIFVISMIWGRPSAGVFSQIDCMLNNLQTLRFEPNADLDNSPPKSYRRQDSS